MNNQSVTTNTQTDAGSNASNQEPMSKGNLPVSDGAICMSPLPSVLFGTTLPEKCGRWPYTSVCRYTNIAPPLTDTNDIPDVVRLTMNAEFRLIRDNTEVQGRTFEMPRVLLRYTNADVPLIFGILSNTLLKVALHACRTNVAAETHHASGHIDGPDVCESMLLDESRTIDQCRAIALTGHTDEKGMTFEESDFSAPLKYQHGTCKTEELPVPDFAAPGPVNIKVITSLWNGQTTFPPSNLKRKITTQTARDRVISKAVEISISHYLRSKWTNPTGSREQQMGLILASLSKAHTETKRSFGLVANLTGLFDSFSTPSVLDTLHRVTGYRNGPQLAHLIEQTATAGEPTRAKGLPPGTPLAGLLADLHAQAVIDPILDGLNGPYIRYGVNLLVLGNTEADAVADFSKINAALSPQNVSLDPNRSQIFDLQNLATRLVSSCSWTTNPLNFLGLHVLPAQSGLEFILQNSTILKCLHHLMVEREVLQARLLNGLPKDWCEANYTKSCEAILTGWLNQYAVFTVEQRHADAFQAMAELAIPGWYVKRAGMAIERSQCKFKSYMNYPLSLSYRTKGKHRMLLRRTVKNQSTYHLSELNMDTGGRDLPQVNPDFMVNNHPFMY